LAGQHAALLLLLLQELLLLLLLAVRDELALDLHLLRGAGHLEAPHELLPLRLLLLRAHSKGAGHAPKAHTLP
jgi:hypothetical protein